ncbi:MAG: ATP-binding protein, partial [Bacteroidota bacterium]
KLNAISMYTSKIADDQPKNPDLSKVKEIAHEAIDDLSYMLSNISVKQVEEHSLHYAVHRLFAFLPESMTPDIAFELEEEKLSVVIKMQLYRIIQEVLNNASKYSKATNIDMELIQQGSIVSLKVSDNGVGFDPRKVKGNGLQNITHRVKKSNGLIDISSEVGKGTSVSIKMPIN